MKSATIAEIDYTKHRVARGIGMSSIKDVAEVAGVSTATVSRVLSDRPYVRPEVRERVLAAVAQLKYRPNLVARSLRSQQSNTIGLIVSDIRNSFFTSLSRAVEDAAYAQGYRVIMCNTDENPEKEAMYLSLMGDEQVAGAIFSPAGHTLSNFSDLKVDFPVVLVDRAPKNGDVDAILLDNVAAAYDLTLHLIQRGYRQIAGIFGDAATTGQHRRQGYETALRQHGITPQSQYIKNVQPRLEAGCAAVLELLRLPQPPDALLTGNSLLTAGALQAIRQHNLQIPQQIALVGFDETTWASLVQPALTVLAQPVDEIGKTAVELLLKRVADPDRSARKVILQGRLLVRESSAPRA
jgi:LacI family transcriptional regulator, fructose operon transcriptional repressor